MKFMLVVTFCSFLTGECPVQFYDDSIHENWSSCMKEGISKRIIAIKSEVKDL